MPLGVESDPFARRHSGASPGRKTVDAGTVEPPAAPAHRNRPPAAPSSNHPRPGAGRSRKTRTSSAHTAPPALVFFFLPRFRARSRRRGPRSWKPTSRARPMRTPGRSRRPRTRPAAPISSRPPTASSTAAHARQRQPPAPSSRQQHTTYHARPQQLTTQSPKHSTPPALHTRRQPQPPAPNRTAQNAPPRPSAGGVRFFTLRYIAPQV